MSNPSDAIIDDLEEYIFKVHLPETERLPPMQDALQQTLLRPHYQTIIHNTTVPNPEVQAYGWNMEHNVWVLMMNI